MADIKKLGIFGNNKGLDKMKEEIARKESLSAERSLKVSNSSKADIERTRLTSDIKVSTGKVGAPIRKFDRIFATKQSLKLSPLLNITSRILVEKYETSITRDELLRQALDDYIKQNLSQEDKLDLYNDVKREVATFRHSKNENMTVPETNEQGIIIRTPEEIEAESEAEIIKKWGINKNKK